MTAAVIALILITVGWFAIRWSEESHRLTDLAATVLSTPLADDDELCDVHGQWCAADWCHSDWCQR
jgi:hypothetical protein